jgi:hypothetical protein
MGFVLGVGFALACGWVGTAPAATHRNSSAAPPGAKQLGPGATLPDSVLARVGDRSITVSAFLVARRGMSGPPPDSLTPEAARGFLELLVKRELLAHEALKTAWAWTPAESAQFLLVRDHQRMRRALEAELVEARQALAPADSADESALGIAARDRAVSRLNVVFDEAAVARVTRGFTTLPRPSADSSLGSQIAALSTTPRVPAADSTAVLARSTAGDYRADELLRAWNRLSPAYRPRIESEEQVRDLVRNGLFERALRVRAERLSLRAVDVRELDDERERIAVAHLIERDVIGRIARDPATLERFHREHAADWSLPTRVRALRLEMSSHADAQDLAAGLRDRAAAESLAARARRNGIEYVVEASAISDSTLFVEGMRAGPGAVIGPWASGSDFVVARIDAVLPGRTPEFSEVRGAVERRWVEIETRRRLEALCDRIAAVTRVAVNARALERRVWDGGGRTQAARD